MYNRWLLKVSALLFAMACADESAAPDPEGAADSGARPSDARVAAIDADSADAAALCDGCGPVCDPPNTLPLEGKCVPSCGVAGGNTCTGSSATLCDGLPALASFDCAKCCSRPIYPGPRAASFHVVVAADTDRWDSIFAEAQAQPSAGPMITSQNLPIGLTHDQWVLKLNATCCGTGPQLADAIHQALTPVATAPRLVIIDELNSKTVTTVGDAAAQMQARYPQWAGRWGSFIVNGTSVQYSGLQPAVDNLLQAGAFVSVELYPLQSSYCASGVTAGARDQWLADFFRGGQGAFPGDRFDWLMKRRANLSSASAITVAFGVTDTYMNGAGPAVFLDRMFYVWRTHSGYPSTILVANGGVGGWKWDASAVSNTSRDLAFKESFDHYCVAGNAASLKGQVACP